ncbi:pyruvate kinase [Pelagophyceae sp. CCMP2097]|nr:pyruvate kinase [Pelagophyceae sp. CCMP2097]
MPGCDDDGRGLTRKKTKVICTVGPACWDVETMTRLIDAGCNVARLNFSHGDHADHEAALKRVRAAAALRPSRNLAILLDTKGPEIRLGKFKPECQGKIHLLAGQKIEISTDSNLLGDGNKISCSYSRLAETVTPGATILVADGSLVLTVLEARAGCVACRVENTVSISERKNVNLPNLKVDLPILSPRDIDDLLKFAVPQGVDFVAASFVQSAADIATIRKAPRGVLDSGGGHRVRIIAKIENQEGLDNFASILAAADGIMVARGDLGMEIPPETVFREQKRMILECRAASKPCIVATQMLESMIVNPRPTRAECSDVANAVLDGADCVMLSGETASGAFPVAAAEMMARTCLEAEAVQRAGDAAGYDAIFGLMKAARAGHCITAAESAASSAVKCAVDVGAPAIVVLSETGNSARLLATFHADATIVAVCRNGNVARQVEGYLSNVRAVHTDLPRGAGAHVRLAFRRGKDIGLFRDGDLAVTLHTHRNAQGGKDWMIRILTVTPEDPASGND